MYKISILSTGKTKEHWLQNAVEEYEKRLSQEVKFDYFWAKNDAQLEKAARKFPQLICLDPQGKQMKSEDFALFFSKQLELGGTHLAIVIGGPEGLPPSLKKCSQLISLSKMTFTHQIARLILMEQIYRSFEVIKGSPYHK